MIQKVRFAARKNAFLIGDKIRFFADIFINLTRKCPKRSQTIARTKSYLSHTFSFPTDSCGRTCALLKSVEKTLENLISECTCCQWTCVNVYLISDIQKISLLEGLQVLGLQQFLLHCLQQQYSLQLYLLLLLLLQYPRLLLLLSFLQVYTLDLSEK